MVKSGFSGVLSGRIAKRQIGQARAVLLVALGRGTSEPAAVWRHAAEDLGAACAGWLAPHLAHAKSEY